jgi:hypothetical protein
MKKAGLDPAVLKAPKLLEASGKSLDELGAATRAEGDPARRSAWQLLNKVNDTRMSTLRLLARTLGVPVKELVAERNTDSSLLRQHAGQQGPRVRSSSLVVLCAISGLEWAG